MNLVNKPLELIRIERLSECLVADQRPVAPSFPPVLEPRQHLSFDETARLPRGEGEIILLSKAVPPCCQLRNFFLEPLAPP
jgi:hypothetical protein